MIVRVHIDARWNTPVRWLSHTLLGAGALTMFIVMGCEIESLLYQAVQARQFGQAVREAAITEPLPPPIHLPRPLLRSPELNVLDPLLIGRIEIPRLGLAAMVREGVGADTLRKAVGHVPGTALPGHAGNFVVAGHRDSFFRGLRSIRSGDEIRIITLAGAFTYNVQTLSIVGPGDTEVLQPTEAAVCTLVTCFPFDYIGPAPRRFIVRAVGGADHRF